MDEGTPIEEASVADGAAEHRAAAAPESETVLGEGHLDTLLPPVGATEGEGDTGVIAVAEVAPSDLPEGERLLDQTDVAPAGEGAPAIVEGDPAAETKEGEGAPATAEGDPAEKKEGEEPKEQKVVIPPGKVMVKLTGDWGKPAKAILPIDSKLPDIRRKCASAAGVKRMEFELMMDGKTMWEARKEWFKDFSGKEVDLTWHRIDLVERLLKAQHLDGINGLHRLTKRSALHFAAILGDSDLVESILKRKDLEDGFVNIQDTFGDTALTLASICGDTPSVGQLIAGLADPELMTVCGRTALMLAAEHGHDETVGILLDNKAALENPVPGRTVPNALHLAKLNLRTEVVMIIENFIRKRKEAASGVPKEEEEQEDAGEEQEEDL